MATIQHIYQMPQIGPDSRDLYILTNPWHNHLPELTGQVGAYQNLGSEIPEHFELYIKIHHREIFDCERICEIGSLWSSFQHKPIMLFMHAGRGGADEEYRFITDKIAFEQAINKLASLITGTKELPDLCSPDKKIDDLYFYGRKLEDYFGILEVEDE